MAISLRNPMTIMATEAGATDSSVKITNYSAGTITGKNFGTAAGVVYLLNRDTHSYVQQTVSTWGDEEIILQNPIDTSTIEGTTCFFVRTAKSANSNKWLIEGDIAVTGYYYLYVKDLSGTVHKLKSNSSADMSILIGTTPSVTSGYVSSTFYGKSATLDNLTFNTSQIVGVQFGTSISYVIPSSFLTGLTNLDQPVVIKSGMTINNNSNFFMYNCRNFNCPLVFDGLTSNQTRCGTYFMGKCINFNQPLNLDRFVYLNANGFLSNCWSFNSELKLTESLNSSARTLAAYFMERCVSFNQPLTLPNNITSIGNYFMYLCSAFNQPLEFDLSVSGSSSIGTYFLCYCYAFNQPLDFSHTKITATPNYFMYCCKSFNSPILFPSTLTTIGSYFLATTTGTTSTVTTNLPYGGSFNQDLDLSNVTSISTYFLANQVSFNSQLNISKVTGIGNYFMQNCASFAQPITIPSTATTIGSSFMSNILTTRKMTVNTSAVPAATSSLNQTSTTSVYLPSQIDATCPAYVSGVYLYGTQRTAWLNGLPNSSSSPWRNLINGGS